DPDFSPALRDRLKRQLEAGETVTFESRHRRKDGSTFPVEVRGRTFWQAGRRFLVSTARDVTHQKQAEEALRESEGRLRGTFENAAIGIAHLGFDGRWLRVNERLCSIVGYSREELLEKTGPEITHPDDLRGCLGPRELASGLQGGDSSGLSFEKRYL